MHLILGAAVALTLMPGLYARSWQLLGLMVGSVLLAVLVSAVSYAVEVTSPIIFNRPKAARYVLVGVAVFTLQAIYANLAGAGQPLPFGVSGFVLVALLCGLMTYTIAHTAFCLRHDSIIALAPAYALILVTYAIALGHAFAAA